VRCTRKVDKLNRGRLMTLDTRDDRTLFFDLLPDLLSHVELLVSHQGLHVPGQPVHEATRKVVLAGTDGVVFVADSSADQHQANRASWHNLVANLATFALERVPVVVQYNKRDLPNADAATGRSVRRAESPILRRARSRRRVVRLLERSRAAWEHSIATSSSPELKIDAQTFRRRSAEHWAK
jgi:hypothetical protein